MGGIIVSCIVHAFMTRWLTANDPSPEANRIAQGTATFDTYGQY
jgi:hypothetical protein